MIKWRLLELREAWLYEDQYGKHLLTLEAKQVGGWIEPATLDLGYLKP